MEELVNMRIQLTLFVDENESQAIEQVRKQYNPEQYQLIKSHVTLCREDELFQLAQIRQNLNQLYLSPLTIEFGTAIRFAMDKGVLLPALGTTGQFDNLRKSILQGVIPTPKVQEAHITLMHPRNSTCTDQLFAEIRQIPIPNQLTFRKISLIEQFDNDPWRILEEFEMKGI